MVKFFKELDRNDFKEMMAFLTIVLAFIYMFAVTFIAIPEENQRFADIILGSLLTIVLGKVLSEYFGNTGETKSDDKSA